MDNIQCVILECGVILITQIEQVISELGEPDCKLINPYICDSSGELSKWLSRLTNDDIVMISSDKILTIVDPSKELLSKYLSITEKK